MTVDFDNLAEKQDEIEQRREQFSEFTSFILGLLLGAVIAIPINLVLRPISYQGDSLKYGPAVLIESAPWWVIPVISFLLLFLLLYVLLISYTIYVGLVGREEVRIPYDDESDDKFITDFRKYVIDQSESYNLESKYEEKRGKSLKKSLPNLIRIILFRNQGKPGIKRLVFIDPNRKLAHKFVITPGPIITWLVGWVYPKEVLELRFEPDEAQICISYDPKNSKAVALLDSLRKNYD